jgi:ring-1,2-phenylacetyl-CoA epoxidase subunit PaaC
MELSTETRSALFDYLLYLGDDRLILGHRLSEWCGHAPELEEDLALANIALDCIGQGSYLLALAGSVENQGRNEDALAYFRDVSQFRNSLLAEQPNGDFAHTIARQFFLDAFWFELLPTLTSSTYKPLAAIAEKALKEVTYHLRHSSEWVLRLGDGTVESHERAQRAVNHLWPFCDELFQARGRDDQLVAEGIAKSQGTLREPWTERVTRVLRKATLKAPDELVGQNGFGRSGNHTIHLEQLLTEMQSLARAHPGARW